MVRIIVHEDGETWTTVESAEIMELSDQQYEEMLKNGTYPKYYRNKKNVKVYNVELK